MCNLKVGDKVKVTLGVYSDSFQYVPPNSIGVIKKELKSMGGIKIFLISFYVCYSEICVDILEECLEKIGFEPEVYDENRDPINDDDILNLKILLGTCSSVEELIKSL